jgi:uncharacterized protein involved in exopolysaccharide biosynthesis
MDPARINALADAIRQAQGEEADGVDFQRLRERLGFVLRAPRRHPWLAAAVFVVFGALGVAAATTMPRTYEAEVKLLAQRNLVVPALTNPTRAWPQDVDSPTRNVSNLIMRHENLVALCADLDLTDRYYARRSPALRYKDKILGDASTQEDRTYVVVGMLEKRLSVRADDSTVTITIDWADARQAFDIASQVQHGFLEARYDDEVAMIGDAISVLQAHAKTEMEHLDVALAEYQKLLAEEGPRTAIVGPVVTMVRSIGGGTGGGAARPSRATLTAAPDPSLAASLEDTRLQIRALEDERQRELAGLRQQLTQAELTLTAQHPSVIALQQQIEPRSQPSPELLQLRNEERSLVAQMAPPPTSPASSTTPRAAYAAGSYAPAGAAPVAPSLPPISALLPAWQADGRAQLARSKLDAAIRSYQEVGDRLDAANVELDIARAAFKYRYTVVTPPEIPKKPKRPIVWIVGIGSVCAALLLAFLVAAAADVRRGRIVEVWQVRRKLGLDVLGELEA